MKILLWKEWKESRVNFVFSMAVILVMKGLILYLQSIPDFKSTARDEGFAFVSIIFISVYGLISGIGMFAMEYTTRTFPYLMSRPVPKITILSSKWMIGIAEILGLEFLTWILLGPTRLSNHILWGEIYVSNYYIFLSYYLVLPILFYFFAVLSSLVFKDTTRSTVVSFILVILLIGIFAKISSLPQLEHSNLVFINFSLILILILLLALSSTIIFLRQQTQ